MSEDNKIVKGDVISLDFSGYIEESNTLFDTTNEQIAQDNGVYDEKSTYAPISYLVGSGRIFPGLEEAIEGAELNKEYEITVPFEKGAGARDSRLVETISIRDFAKQDVQPYVGMEFQSRNRTGIVTAVTAGRVRVDYNSPLAGKNLKYVFTVVSKAQNDDEKIEGILKMDYGTSEGFSISISENVIEIVLPDVCKYDSNWGMAKYRVIADLREALGDKNVRFVEEYVKNVPKEDEPKEEERVPGEIAPEEIPPEEQ